MNAVGKGFPAHHPASSVCQNPPTRYWVGLYDFNRHGGRSCYPSSLSPQSSIRLENRIRGCLNCYLNSQLVTNHQSFPVDGSAGPTFRLQVSPLALDEYCSLRPASSPKLPRPESRVRYLRWQRAIRDPAQRSLHFRKPGRPHRLSHAPAAP